MKIQVVEDGQWSGGGHNVIANVSLAKQLYPEKFSHTGLPVYLRNVVPVSALRSGNYVYLPQNAWAWKGPARSAGELRRRTLLRIASELAARRAKRVIRIGPMIPDYSNSVRTLLPNVLDEPFELDLVKSECATRPLWLPPNASYILVPGSIWSYRNLEVVLDSFKLYRKNGGEADLLLVGGIAASSGAKGIRKRCDRLPNVTLIDMKVSRVELLTAMKYCQLCILSSLVEASPVTMLEAACIGCPILAWDISAFRFLQNEEKINNISFCSDKPSMVSAMQSTFAHDSSSLGSKEYREKRRVEWVESFLECCAGLS